VPSREREVSDLQERRFAFTKGKSASDAAQMIRLNSKKEAVKPEIEFYNRNADDSSTTGFIWLTEKKKAAGLDILATDINEAVEVALPLDNEGIQVTMADVRKYAAEEKISIEAALKRVYDLSRKKER